MDDAIDEGGILGDGQVHVEDGGGRAGADARGDPVLQLVQLLARLDQGLFEPRDLLRHVFGSDVVFGHDLFRHAVDIDPAAGNAR